MPVRRVGVLGGTFDPPHLGHLVVASEAHARCDLDEVLLVPAGQPWQKQHRPVTPAEHRVAMTRLVVEGDDRLRVSLADVRRPGPTYTVDTVAALRAELGEVHLHLLVGSDTLAGLPGWHRAGALLSDEALSFVVHERPGHAGVPLPPGASPDRVVRLPGPLVDVSSSMLRERAASGLPLRYLVPESVERYVAEHRLYGAAA